MNIKNKRGAIFFWVMAMVGLLGLMGASLMKVVSKDVFTVQYLVRSSQAFFLADAGINEAFSQLKANFNNTASINKTVNLGGYNGSYTVTISSNGDTKIVTSIGTVKDAIRKIVAEFSGPPNYEAFNYAIFANRNILNESIIGLNFTINGDVFANNDITLETLLAFNIDINAYGGRPGGVYAYHSTPVINSWLGSINADGGFHKSDSMINFPTIDFGWYLNKVNEESGVKITGTKTWYGHDTISSPNYITYVDGDVNFNKKHWYHLTEEVVLNGCLVVTGKVTINPGVIINHAKYSNYPAIICQGDLGGLGRLNFNGLVYSKGGTLNSLFGNKTGCMMASKDVKLSGPFGLLGTINLTWTCEDPPGLTQNPVVMEAWSE